MLKCKHRSNRESFMENINKFKVFTIIIICTFVFAIGAMYTNTKDVTNDKTADQQEAYQQEEDRYIRNSSNDVQAELRNINRRLDELSAKVNNNRNRRNSDTSGTNLKCKIAGTLSNRGMEEMSPNAAVNDARINNNDLVILCSF